MKKQCLLLLAGFILTANLTFCQSNTVASGGNGSGSGGAVSFSIGQIDYISSTGNPGTINQGVQQPYEIYLISGIDEFGQDINVSIGPNPTIDILNIYVNEQFDGIYYKLFDLNGKELTSTQKLIQHAQIDLSGYPIGDYQLMIIQFDKIIQSYKILKK